MRLLLVCLLAVLHAGEPSFLLRPDHPEGVYAAGATVRITISRRDGLAMPTTGVSARLVRNNRDAVAEATVTPGDAGWTLLLSDAQPGWYVCRVDSTEPKATAQVGIVVDPGSFQPSFPDPADLRAVWDARLAALGPAQPLVLPLDDAQRANEADGSALEQAGCQRFAVEIPTCGAWAPMRGYLALPPKARPTGHPAILQLHAAGVDGDWCLARSVAAMRLASELGAIVLDINAHGLPPGLAKDAYTAAANGPLKNYANQGREDAESWYFVGMYLRLLRGTAFLAERPEWNGTHLVAMGESQGGGQALAAAALDQRVSAVIATVPALCDIRAPLANRPWAWPMVFAGVSDPAQQQRIGAAVASCDNAHLAPWSRAASLVIVGLVDTTCPATAVISTWNRLPQPKRLVVYPHRPHQDISRDDVALGQVDTVRRTFLREHLGLAP
jgi:cephalosporin-C deacetylase-like acetyl esterase